MISRSGKQGMTKKSKSPITIVSSDLHRRAEEMLLRRSRRKGNIPHSDLQSVVHELEVHQVELEMQNEELQRAQQELEAYGEKYFDLYDLAPVGYVTLNEKGIIVEANITAAALLGKERSDLVRQPLSRFIFGEDQDLYRHCHRQLVASRAQQFCEMRMVKKNGSPFWVRLDISAAQSVDDIMRTRAVIVDVSRLKQAEDESRQAAADLKKSHEQLRSLAAHLQSIREEERANISREIHDELGQSLIALKMVLSATTAKLSTTRKNKEIAGKLNEAAGLVSSTLESVKQICTDLRPTLLDHIGLGAAMEWQCEQFQERTGVECGVDVESDIFKGDTAVALFRVFQEALTNVTKHSEATKVEAKLKKENGNIVLEIHDNGVGLTGDQISKRHSFGLLGMRERLYPFGGMISIEGKKQRGTTLTAIIPVADTATEK
jgi:PAS domain S-box-containing protein